MKANYKGEKAKETLIECAAELFLQKGYNATGINDILGAAKMSKGSFYFYFTSKSALAMEVADYYNKKKVDEISSAAKGKSWIDFIETITGNEIEKAEQEKSYGCPNATLGMEIAFSDPEIAQKYYSTLKSQINIFASVLENTGVSKESAVSTAERAFSVYEGYLLLYRISKNINELEKMKRDLKTII